MTTLLAMLLAGAAAIVAVPPRPTDRRLDRLGLRDAVDRPVRRQRPGGPVATSAGDGPQRWRRGTVQEPDQPDQVPQPPLLLQPVARTAIAMAAGLAVAVSLGGPTGVVLGLATVGAVPALIARLPDPTTTARERRLARDLPLALELIAACLTAGAPFPVALQAVSTDLPGPLSTLLADVARQLALGAAPAAAWRRVDELETLQPLVETMSRVGDSGAALALALRRLAAEERNRARQAQEAAVRRVGVFVVIPLGVCFLPAFLLIGVVPIVAGLVGDLVI